MPHELKMLVRRNVELNVWPNRMYEFQCVCVCVCVKFVSKLLFLNPGLTC